MSSPCIFLLIEEGKGGLRMGSARQRLRLINKVFKKWFCIWITRSAGVVGREHEAIDANFDKLDIVIAAAWCGGFVAWNLFFPIEAIYELDCEDMDVLLGQAVATLGDLSMAFSTAGIHAFGYGANSLETHATFDDAHLAICCGDRFPEGRRFWFVSAGSGEESPGFKFKGRCASSCWVIQNVTLKCFAGSWLIDLKDSALSWRWLSCSSV